MKVQCIAVIASTGLVSALGYTRLRVSLPPTAQPTEPPCNELNMHNPVMLQKMTKGYCFDANMGDIVKFYKKTGYTSAACEAACLQDASFCDAVSFDASTGDCNFHQRCDVPPVGGNVVGIFHSGQTISEGDSGTDSNNSVICFFKYDMNR